MTETIRLAKRVAELVPCSRRDAELTIENGAVKVDGVVIEEPGYRIAADQLVEVVPGATAEPSEPVTILFHKPAGIDTGSLAIPDMAAILPLLTAQTRMAGERSGIRLLKRHFSAVKMTDALETNASGLVVLTEDWRTVRKLVADRERIEQEFLVEVSGQLAPDGLALLNHGLRFSGKPLPSAKVSWQNETRLRFALKAPARGQIEHMCQAVGLSVVSMRRLRIGRMSLATLPPGQWRYLLKYEQF
ncbi:MAG: rRNA pseudouridine synthase [Janthinobacterium lividum]